TRQGSFIIKSNEPNPCEAPFVPDNLNNLLNDKQATRDEGVRSMSNHAEQAAEQTKAQSERKAEAAEKKSLKAKEKAERKKKKKQEKAEKKKNKIRKKRLFPIPLRIVTVLLLAGFALISGLMIGYGVLGGQEEPREVLEMETWQYLIDYVTKDE